MLSTDLIDLVNSGRAWAFVGSGVSIDADYPAWKSLVERVLDVTPPAVRAEIRHDERFAGAWTAARYEACFSAIQRHTDREHLEACVSASLTGAPAKARIASAIAEWPFAGYATSNYDDLLETVLAKQPPGWVPVGNTDDEIRKVSGDATGIVWHVHGGVKLPSEKSKLIIAVADYDGVYLEGSRLQRQMHALLSQRRFVFFGFGFNDPEFVRLLRAVSKYTNPTSPTIAFLSDVPKEYDRRLQLREEFNVEVIPYQIVEGSHAALLELLRLYQPFILTRSLRFGEALRPCPSYDPETTGLLTYNRLALSRGAPVAEDALAALLRARILALLRHHGIYTLDDLSKDLAERTRILTDVSHVPADPRNNANLDAISAALTALEKHDLIARFDGGQGAAVDLTDAGRRLTDEQAARGQLLSDQFRASLLSRVVNANPAIVGDAQVRVVSAAETFLKESVTRRALGVAMVWHAPNADFQRFHMVALLQALPQYLEQMANAVEAEALIALVRGVLSETTEQESMYLGLLIQSQFGVHLLGLDTDATNARIRELSRTLFLLDATTMIPLLGRASTGHAAAKQLLDQITTVGATPASTDLLAVEVAEHASWALRALGPSTEVSSIQGLAASTGRAGARNNVFLEGCEVEAERGRPLDLRRYLDSVCGTPDGHLATPDVFQYALSSLGVACLAFKDWEGFDPRLWAERDAVQAAIEERRRANGTYQHPRQVQAEAEALLVVQGARQGLLGIAGRKFTGAYFVSHTRIIDDVAAARTPITIRPQAVQQWLSTVTACPPEELKFIIDGMLWELSERGMSFVNTRRISNVFSPLISAAKGQLEEELVNERNMITSLYGEDAAKAFGAVDPLDAPFVSGSYFYSKSKQLEAEIGRQKAAREKAERLAIITSKERLELADLRASKTATEIRTKEKRRKMAAKRSSSKRKKKNKK